MVYRVPIKDIQFVLNELADLPGVCTLPCFEECSVELVDTVLVEAAHFAEGVLAPLNQIGDQQGARWDNGQVMTPPGFKRAWKQYVEAGWAGLRAPAEFDGQGLPALVAMAVEEMWCAANLSFSLAPMLTTAAVEMLAYHASDRLKARYLRYLSTGQWTGTMNLTEPHAGSDLAQVRTRATPCVEEGSYFIIGQKIFITWGDHDMADNIVHLVLARLPHAPAGVKGLSLFIVPKFLVNDDGTLGERNDVRCVSIEHKLGIHGSPTAVMSFGDKGGAVGYLVGDAHNGLSYMFTMMNYARLSVGIQGMAVSERAYQKAVEYARDRVQGRTVGSVDAAVPIIRHPDIRRMLMTMKSQIEAQRALALVTACALDCAAHHPLLAKRTASQALVNFLVPIVKGWNSEQANEITSLAVQIHGGMGFIEETGVAQYLRDARITSIYEGTTGIQALDLISRKMALENGDTARTLLAEVRSTACQLNRVGLTTLASHLSHALEDAERCVMYILAYFDTQPALPSAGAVPFLKLMGIVLGGWQLGRAALVAHHHLANDEGDVEFYHAKIVTARFFGEHLLPQVSSLATAILHGAGTVMELDDALF